jgi:molybdopterin-guanine dinucleotide biosynthesis protein MobB
MRVLALAVGSTVRIMACASSSRIEPSIHVFRVRGLPRVRNPFGEAKAMMWAMVVSEVARSTLFDGEPVLAVGGSSGSDRETVLEEVIRCLTGRGLRVAAVRHDPHGIEFDRQGKASGNFFRAGATVHLRAPGELSWRIPRDVGPGLEAAIGQLLTHHDVVLVEGHEDTPLPKVWCAARNSGSPPSGLAGLRGILPWGADRPRALERLVDQMLEEALAARPLLGGVMVGGSSRRMGLAKHHLVVGGRSLLRRSADALRGVVAQLVVLGRAELPDDVAADAQLADAPGCGEGPLAAMLTAWRWAPRCAWLMAACDMPAITSEALDWLLGHRRPGRWAVMPRWRSGHLEPLLAVYEPQAAYLFAQQLGSGRLSLHGISSHETVHTPTIPASLGGAWLNVNSPDDLEHLAD